MTPAKRDQVRAALESAYVFLSGKKLYSNGAGGQIIGCEGYRIISSGFAFADVDNKISEAISIIDAEKEQDGELPSNWTEAEQIYQIVDSIRDQKSECEWEISSSKAMEIIHAYAARHARPMPDLTVDIETVRSFIKTARKWGVPGTRESGICLDRIEQAVNIPELPDSSTGSKCDGANCFSCANPCDQYLNRIR